MLELFIQERILSFVKTFRVVKEEQIIKFFSDQGRQNVRQEIAILKRGKRLFEVGDGLLSIVQTIHCSLSQYDSCLDALEAMCLLRSDDVFWMCSMPYPIDIMFGTSDNIVYDVTTFSENWQAKYSLTEMVRKNLCPPDEEDHVKHVAVVRDETIIPKIFPLGFEMFVLLKPDGQIETYK